VGVRAIDASAPGGIPDAPFDDPPISFELDGALAPQDIVKAKPPPELVTAVAGRVDRPRLVLPPRYGRWLAGAPRDLAAAAARWLTELNGDPARRVAAALGTRVVQERQEELMAAAWDQVGEILRANQLLRQAQMGRAASSRIFQRCFRILNGSDADLAGLALAGPAISQIRVEAHVTVRGAVRPSCLPLLALSGAFRRSMRPNGPFGRRVRRWQASDSPPRVGVLIAGLASGILDDPGLPPPVGVVADHRDLEAFLQTVAARQVPPPLRERLRAVLGTAGTVAEREGPPDCASLSAGGIQAALDTGLDPTVTIPARVRAQLAVPQGVWDPPDRIDPIMAAPRITAPMVRPLVELGQDWLIPGLGAVPPRTVAILVPNRKFIEAYMVGLNHEMGRELLWRGFPTDQRGTVFDRFWDTAASAGQAGTPEVDITSIHGWSSGSALGDHAAGAEAPIVVLIRGELARRFPDATIFMQVAEAQGPGRAPRLPIGGNATRLPLFRGRLDPDVLYLGFDIPAGSAKGLPPRTQGWYLEFQEEPGQLAFGLSRADGNAAAADPATWTSWNDIVWEAMRLTPGGYIDLAAMAAKGFATGANQIPAGLRLSPAWDGRADTMAAITVKRPFRLYVHASDFLP
jgi:hypothetical protein